MQDGKTALDFAKQHGPTEIVQLLAAHDTTTPVEAKVRVKMACVCVCVCVPQRVMVRGSDYFNGSWLHSL